MGFLDDALNKTKEVLDVAYKKTEEVVSVEKQKFDISSIKNKREKDFAELGKLCYELLKNDENASNEIKALIAAIGEKNAEIDKKNAEIQAVKNKKICPKCNANIEQNAVFCSACGEKLEVEE